MIIKATDLGINFKKSRFRSGTVKSAIVKLLSMGRNKQTKMKDHFWALRNLSFELEQGEILGVIGRNGAGKSTLLRTIAGIYELDEGSIVVNGSVSTLLSLGTGFKQELSGIENIYLNGVILGFKKTEIDENLQQIIDFSELNDFIYEPVKNYSSGMKARLGFSISVFMKRDVMLIDEILGVGDFNFRKKSQEKLLNIIREGRTVVLVSHSMESIKKFATQVLWLDKGKMMALGEPEDVIAQYLNHN